ncbi:MAG TPA: hypothetical protein VEC19_08360 [Usitatibacter sp.]|nr:hypothetical protein [Usitatibacter sp.]
MRVPKLFLLALLCAPAAQAQVAYSEARILDRDPAVLSRGELRECMARDEVLADRRARLDADQVHVDAEGAAITEEGARLARELAQLDSGNAAAVADYNARSAAHNRRVHDHNARVAQTNDRAAMLNADAAALDARCARPFRPRDRDAVLWERGAIR